MVMDIWRWEALMVMLMVMALAEAESAASISSQSNATFGIAMPQEEWNRTFGGGEDDMGTFVQETSDGGYIIVGYTASYGADVPYSWLIKAPLRGDLWLIKTDSNGTKEWDRPFGGFGKEFGFSVQQTKDGGYVMTGAKKTSLVGNYDLWIIKTDAKGQMEWERTFGGSNDDLGFSIQQTDDGGYIAAGYTSYGLGNMLYLVKTDPQGNKVWERAYGGKNSAEGSSIQETRDGGYIIAGYTSSQGAGKEDVWLLKTDAKGIKEWDKTFGGSARDIGLSVEETKEGGYILTGLTESFGAGNGDVWLIKTDSAGREEWNITFGGPNFDEGSTVQQTTDGGYIITGFNTTPKPLSTSTSWFFQPANLSRVWLIKTDSSGNKKWDMTFGGQGNDWGNSGQETKEGDYILTGVTESYGAGKKDAWLIKVRGVKK
jgi:hypothetical protein